MTQMSMNQVHMNGQPGSGPMQMMAGPNGAMQRGGGVPGQGQGDDMAAHNNHDYQSRLNTAIYDYFLKNQEWDMARAMSKSQLKPHYKQQQGPRRVNGMDAGNEMDQDGKEDSGDAKRPSDLPLAGGMDALAHESSFLLDWWSMFWDIFENRNPNKPAKNAAALQYMQHTQVGETRSFYTTQYD